MRTHPLARLPLVGVLALVFLALPASLNLPTASAASTGVQLQRIGQPTWKPVDFHLFSAPVGSASSGYAEAFALPPKVLPPPEHVLIDGLGVGPGAPHAPPYESEIAAGVERLGLRDAHRFDMSQFSNGSGVFLLWMTVPDPGTIGSSPDFSSGPIIPNTLFPIHISAVTYLDGAVFDPFLTAFDVPALTPTLDPRFDVDGHSHFPIFVADATDFSILPPGTDLTGRYTYQVSMVDRTGNGWMIRAHFVVQP